MRGYVCVCACRHWGGGGAREGGDGGAVLGCHESERTVVVAAAE